MNLPKTPLRFIFYFVKQQWFKVLFMLFASVVWAIKDTLFPYFLKVFVNVLDKHAAQPMVAMHLVGGLFLLLTVIWIGSEIFQRLQGVVAIYFYPKFRNNIRNELLAYIKLHSNEYFANHFAGDIANKISDLPVSCQTILEIFIVQLFTAVLYVIFAVVMFFYINPVFAGIVIGWLFLHSLITFAALFKGNSLWDIHAKSVSTLNGNIVDSLTNILNVRLFARNKYEANYLAQYEQDEVIKSNAAMWTIEWANIGYAISGSFLILGTVYALLYGWSKHWVTLGDFAQVGMQTLWLLGWVWHVSFVLNQLVREQGTVKNALRLINVKHEILDSPNAKTLQVNKGEIEFKNVGFSYRKNRSVFQNLNVRIAAGEKVGLVGFSGSGKSTFVNLILRFYDLQRGEICIDKQNIALVTQDSLRSQISMIPQDPSLFHRTLMENIRYGRLDATDAEVITAAKMAHCHEFIEMLDGHYDALVGERGVKLSGGQRQRIAIARAILKNSPIIILDEATSALDSVTEKLIHESLHQVMQGRTTLAIAHRLSTLSEMDRILVFHHGKIIEEGSKDSLLQAKGHFYKLWNMQMDGYLPETDA